MSVPFAEFLVGALAMHVVVGIVFSCLFLWRWIGALDSAAEHGSIGFKCLVFPGVTVLWPFFVIRLVRGSHP